LDLNVLVRASGGKPNPDERPNSSGFTVFSKYSGLTFLVKDLKKTSEFYEALGFRLGKQENGHLTAYVNWFWIDFKTADPASQYLHLKVENADEFYAGVLEKGMKPDTAPEGKATTGRSFTLRDPDGYKLVFFEKK
jgi:catechol 2,3-dioxygenase-like lactoylglutathione lyase family enzyme